MEYIAEIGEYIIATDKDDIVKTFALSTCVAVVIYDINKKILAMAHIILPTSTNNTIDEKHNSAKYADKALYSIFKKMNIKYGCNKDDFRVSLFGGIDSEHGNYFKIGERNLVVIKEILDKMNIRYDATNTGGRISRTLIAHVATGEVYIKTLPIVSKEN